MSVSPQERTRAARAAFNAKFSTPEEKSRHFADLARKRAGRIELSAEEAQALTNVYDILRRVAERTRRNGGG